MTNEEKAHKIIGEGCNKQNCSECGGSLSVAGGCMEFRHLKEMAEWKEQQMIVKAVDWLQSHANDFMPASYSLQKYDTNLLLYYFKKAMKGGEE